MSMLAYVIEGRPVSWRRANVVNGRPTTDKKQRQAKLRYRLAACAALGGRSWDLSGTYCVQVDAYYPDRRFGDIDRISGVVLDSLETVAYATDRQVSELVVTRQVDAERPRLVVQVTAIAE